MTEIRLRGQRRPDADRTVDPVETLYAEDAPGEEFSYRVVDEVMPGSGRAATRRAAIHLDEGDVLEVEDGDGVVTFHTAASVPDGDLARALEAAPTRSAADPVVRVTRARLTLPDRIARDVEVVHDAIADDRLDFVAGRLLDAAAAAAMTRVVAWIEKPISDEEYQAPDAGERRRKRPKQHGLYRLDPDLVVDPARRLDARGGLEGGDDPYLVLLHGTFSHTEAAFGGLRGKGDWERLAGRYDDRLVALEHPTLSVGPADNALDAVRLLPDGARLHLLSHSRGGLIGDVLALASSDRPVVAGTGPLAERIEEVRTEMRDRRLQVTRFARVACPGSGTTLASRRLDLYATALFNLFNLVPGVGQSGVTEMVKRFALTLLDKRSDPRLVPGIEAMMPESPLIRALATAPAVDDGLGVIAGDIEGRGLLDRLKVIATNLFYLEDHDLVVNTSAMDRGVLRPAARRAFFKGPGVSHSSYFSDDASRKAICAWLEGQGADIEPFTPLRVRRPATRARGDGPAGPPVVVVPDVFGSVLTTGDGTVVWPDVAGLATLTVPAALDPASPRSTPALVDAYQPLLDRLGDDHTVHPLPYDWRRGFDEAGELLADTLARLAADELGPRHIVTHGAGAHVLAAALRAHPDLLTPADPLTGRVVMLSPPLDGSARGEALVAGVGELPAQLALIDPDCSQAVLAKLFGELPSLQQLTVPVEDAGPLESGLFDGAHAVFGTAPSTLVSSDDGIGATTAGDGNVAFPAPTRPGMATWFHPSPAAGMPGDEALAGDVARLLAGREPRQLMQRPIDADARSLPVEDVTGRIQFPSAEDLVTAAMGGRPRPAEGAAPQSLRVSVVHGDLSHVALPLLVGVYEGTPIRGAEAALDRRMDGVLQTRVALGRFPGPVGTTDVVDSPVEGAPRAVIIGMGHNGDLNSPRLASGVHQALLGLAARLVEEGDHRPLTVATVLIGTSGAVSIPVSTSLSAIVTGVLRANRRLREATVPLAIEHLMVIELFEDRAIEAAGAARNLAADVHLVSDEQLVVDATLQPGRGGLPGLPPPEYHRDRWRTIRVGVADRRTAPTDSPERPLQQVDLQFTSIGAGAGAEQWVTRNQRDLLDAMISRAIEDPAVDRQTYNTLYELLVPLGLKGQSRENENLLYVVDEAASTIPFEMLSPRLDDTGVVPFAVDVGLLRQLETSTFRANVRPAAGHRALVIGDPPTTRYERLPGAITEARRVKAVLEEHGYLVESLIPADVNDERSVDFLSIINALFRYDYRIVHIAAHGEYDPRPGGRSGIVIGDDRYLTADTIRQMPTTPDLVFLNACHVGAMVPRTDLGDAADTGPRGAEWRPDRLAASVSRSLIDNGVRTVVAAGWAVADQAAADFAEHLYDRLLSGVDLGNAVQTARSRVYEDHRHVNTWGAYQIYGQPAFRLDRVEPDSRPAPPLVSRKQLVERLQRLKTDAGRVETDERVREIGTEVDELLARAAVSWMGGEPLAVAGEVAFELGDYETAVERLRAAVDDWGSEAPLRSVELLVSALVKLAVERRDESSAALLESARDLVEHLAGLGITPERSGLHGSFWRRQLLLTPSQGAIVPRRTAVRNALNAYRRGWETALRRGKHDYYLGPNLALLLWVSGDDDTQGIGEILRHSREAAAAGNDFWARVTPVDVSLVEAIVDGSLPDRRNDIAEAYRGVVRAGSSRKQRLTVAEHLEIVEAAVPRTAPKPLREAIGELRRDLEDDLG